jgi:hypothetical protein
LTPEVSRNPAGSQHGKVHTLRLPLRIYCVCHRLKGRTMMVQNLRIAFAVTLLALAAVGVDSASAGTAIEYGLISDWP